MRAALRLAALATVWVTSAGCPGIPDLRFDDGSDAAGGGGAKGMGDDATTATSGDAAADAGGYGDLPDVFDAPDVLALEAAAPDAEALDAAGDAATASCPTTAPAGTICCGKTVCVGNKGQCGDCTACHLCDLQGFCCPAKVICATSISGCEK
jgi:hypothetical protein